MDNGHEPATKQDLESLKQDLEALETRLTGQMSASESRMIEAMRDGQTELLKAFFNFAETHEAKLRDTVLNTNLLREQMLVLERRQTELEKRVNMLLVRPLPPDSPSQSPSS